MNEWVKTSNLTEVLQQGEPTPTWIRRRGSRIKARRKQCLTGCLLPLMPAPRQSSQYSGTVRLYFLIMQCSSFRFSIH
jgi:hypothetical protein